VDLLAHQAVKLLQADRDKLLAELPLAERNIQETAPFAQLPNNSAVDQVTELVIPTPEVANVLADGLADHAQ